MHPTVKITIFKTTLTYPNRNRSPGRNTGSMQISFDTNSTMLVWSSLARNKTARVSSDFSLINSIGLLLPD